MDAADPISDLEPLDVAAETKIGLCLSGGGFRATLFHAGALLRLNECGLLRRIDVIASVSGGSIAAGLLALSWPKFVFQADIAAKFDQVFLDPLMAF